MKMRSENGEFDSRSYASAEVLPMKLIVNKPLIHSCLDHGKVLPIHLQLSPTNRCNFDCAYCSCSGRKKSLELPIDKIMKFIYEFSSLGGQSATITGGGEPLLHRHFAVMIDEILARNIRIGLVTNGTQWRRTEESRYFKNITWIRISSSDILEVLLKRVGSNLIEWFQNIDDMVALYPDVDWAFTHVLTKHPDERLIGDLIEFANDHNFTHVRVVNDIFEADQLHLTMETVRANILHRGIDERRVNWQSRSTWGKGQRKCWISLLKPVLGADEYLYPCCGVQYALETPSRDFESTMRMGHMNQLKDIILHQKHFDGSICVKCYYKNYNDVLDVMLNGLAHESFV